MLHLPAQPVGFPYLERFELRRAPDLDQGVFSPWQLTLVLSPPADSESRRRWFMRFDDVRDLTIMAWLLWTVWLQIEITDVRSHQLEGIRFKVTEEENGAFSFYCAYVEGHEIELPSGAAAFAP